MSHFMHMQIQSFRTRGSIPLPKVKHLFHQRSILAEKTFPNLKTEQSSTKFVVFDGLLKSAARGVRHGASLESSVFENDEKVRDLLLFIEPLVPRLEAGQCFKVQGFQALQDALRVMVASKGLRFDPEGLWMNGVWPQRAVQPAPPSLRSIRVEAGAMARGMSMPLCPAQGVV